MKYRMATAVMGLSLLATLALAQSGEEAMKEYQAAHQKMMNAMMAPMTGDPDKDFVLMMIPHHQGAIDMANVEIEYGKDPVLVALARKIVEAQKPEIEAMEAWQSEHAK